MSCHWVIHERAKIDPQLLELSQGDTLIARLLTNRKIDSVKLAKYFLDLKNIDPSDSYEIPELKNAVIRIQQAITKQEKITIYGDYDVDGTSSTALLIRAFKMIGIVVNYYIPNRHSEGYGLNKAALEAIYQEGSGLVITCDCGISNYDEVNFANSLGLDLIITDHHSIPENTPLSIANCNPKTLAEDHPLHYLPGVGVAYKLAEKILELNIADKSEARALAESLLDLVALGMIADMAPLKSENRYLTIKGLNVLTKTRKAGLRELLFASGVNGNANSEHIGFGLAPRINAAGRLADAKRAVELMITEDPDQAQQLCRELERDNQERQVLCKEITEEALAILANELNPFENNCIVLASENWHHGVIGIVASRLLEIFHLPVFLMATEGNISKGSVRCINLMGLDIYDEMKEIQNHTSLFLKFGGHKMAAGFSCKAEDTDALILAIKEHFKNKLSKENLLKTVKIDAAIKLKELNIDFIARINKLAPFGIDNPQAVFVCPSVRVERIKTLGKDQKHIKLFVKDFEVNKFHEVILWNKAEQFLEEYALNDRPELCLVFSPKINEFNGEQTIVLELKDWKKPEEVDQDFFTRFNQVPSLRA